MPRSSDVTVTGLPEVRRALRRADADTIAAVVAAVADEADETQQDMIAGAPYDTGRLVDGITVQTEDRGLVAVVAETDPARTHIAEFLERGTSSIPAQPFAGPAAAAARRRLPDRVAEHVKRRLNR